MASEIIIRGIPFNANLSGFADESRSGKLILQNSRYACQIELPVKMLKLHKLYPPGKFAGSERWLLAGIPSPNGVKLLKIDLALFCQSSDFEIKEIKPFAHKGFNAFLTHCVSFALKMVLDSFVPARSLANCPLRLLPTALQLFCSIKNRQLFPFIVYPEMQTSCFIGENGADKRSFDIVFDESTRLHRIYILSNRCLLGDTKIKRGGYKRVTRGYRFFAGKLCANLSTPLPDAESLIAARYEEFLLRALWRVAVFAKTFDITYRLNNSYMRKQHIYQKLYDGDLEGFPHDLMTPAFKKALLTQMLEALVHLQLRSIVHRDIKSDNILYHLKKNGRIEWVLCDLGVGYQRGTVSEAEEKERLSEQVGCYYIRPPEVVLPGFFAGKTYDIWSMGVVFAQIFQEDFTGRFGTEIRNWLMWWHAHIVDQRRLNDLRHSWHALPARSFLSEPEEQGSLSHLVWRMLLIYPEERILPCDAMECGKGIVFQDINNINR